MIRIGFFGDGKWSHESFSKLVNDKTVDIKFVTTRYDYKDPVLIELAKNNGIPVEECPNVNSDEFLERISRYKVDIFVSMSFNQIFKPKTFNFPKYGTINCHAGKLPFYRGRNILNWVLINDEKEFGITVHYVDDGIDTGNIIIQRVYKITDEDDYGTLLSRAYTGCADTLYEAIKMIQDGNVKEVKQESIDPVGLYCGIRRAGDEIIEWNLPSRRIFNFVRAVCLPGPMAVTYVNGEEVRINRVREVEGARSYIGIPGQVLGETKNGFYVKTQDSFVEVIDYKYDGKIRVGDRFG